jgi:hypothetical protein
MASFISGAEAGTLSTKPIPPWRTSSSRNWSSNSACGAVSGSTHTLVTIAVAPAARRRRHSATRGLDADRGSWVSSRSQLAGQPSVSIDMQHLFHA